jgi:hypothetical protein
MLVISLYMVFQGFKMLLFSESGTIYSHFLFVCLNCITTTRQSSHQIKRVFETGLSWVSTAYNQNNTRSEVVLALTKINRIRTKNGLGLYELEPKLAQTALWTGRDLNPRLPRCERGDHTELIYRPFSGKTR